MSRDENLAALDGRTTLEQVDRHDALLGRLAQIGHRLGFAPGEGMNVAIRTGMDAYLVARLDGFEETAAVLVAEQVLKRLVKALQEQDRQRIRLT